MSQLQDNYSRRGRCDDPRGASRAEKNNGGLLLIDKILHYLQLHL